MPLEKIENFLFSCFQGVWNETTGMKWFNNTVFLYQTLNIYFPDGIKLNLQLFTVFKKSIHSPKMKTKMHTFA